MCKKLVYLILLVVVFAGSAQAQFIVDDFESYDDSCNAIFYTWMEGWGHSGNPGCGIDPYPGNMSGSTVSYFMPPFVEQTIVHGGGQSMPFAYNNSGSGGRFYYSEATRAVNISPGWDWLTLWFRGNPSNDATFTEQMYVKLNDTKIIYLGDMTDLKSLVWRQWGMSLEGNGVVGAITSISIGFGDEDNNSMPGGSGLVFFDDITVSKICTVPDVVGVTEAEAEVALIDAGFVKGTVTHDYSDTVTAGLVMDQEPDVGTSGPWFPCGSAVAMVISLGPPPPLIIYVDDDAPNDPGPGDPDTSDPGEDGSWEHPFDAIQEAVDAALDGDTVVVLDGTFIGIGNRDIDFRGRAITVRGQNGPENCIIHCEHEGRGFYFHSGETEYAIIDGFTIRSGEADRGGGIYCLDSDPMIANCIIIGNSPDGISLEDSSAVIAETVQVISNSLTGNGTCLVEPNATLHLQDVRVSCNIVGSGTLSVPVGEALIIDGNAVIDLGGTGDGGSNGTINCDGLLKVIDIATVSNAIVNVARASFEGNATIANNIITTQAAQYGQIAVKDTAVVVGNDIHADDDRYMDLNPMLFGGVIQDNQIYVRITQSEDDEEGDVFELRGRDLFCLEPPCEPNTAQLATVPDFDLNTWTIERLELLAGATVRLANRFDFQPPYDSGGNEEVLYVKQLVLGPNSVLDTAFNRLYYESLQMHPTAEIVNLPLLAFSLNDLDFDDDAEFLSRVIHNNLIDPDRPALDRIHVERIVGLEPDPAGMMRMRNLPDLDPTSPNYRRMISARAKGSFAKASEDEIVIRFKYLFESSEPGTELVIYLSDVPEILARNDPQWAEHYLEVARLAAPPLGRPGSVGSRRFAVFQQRVPTEHLSFTEATWIELELVEPQSIGGIVSAGYRAAQSTGGGASVLINDLNPAIWCYGICLDLNSDNFVNEVDFLMVIGELGHPAIEEWDCVDGVLSNDGYVDPHDVVSWDWAMNAAYRLLNFCGVPLVSGSMTISSIAAMSSAPQLSVGSLPSNFSDLLIAGKRGTDDAAGKLEDRLYVFDSNGLCTGWSAPASDRCNIGLVQDLEGKLYQLNSETGLLRLDDPSVVIIPPGEIELTDINEPRYNKAATVYVGIQGEDPDAFGRPIIDAAFDANYVYVVPVVVDPDGNDHYVAAAKLELLDGEEPPYQVVQLYDDPNTFNPDDSDNPNLGGLRGIELDDEGNLYFLNVHSRNESDILWRYEPNGAIERLDLGVKGSNNYVPGPIAMYMSSTTDMLYLASSQHNPEDVNSTVIYGFSTDGPLTLKRSVTMTGMHHVSSITEDLAGESLFAVGFNMDEIPLYPNPTELPFYDPYLARVPSDSNDVQLLSLSDPNSHDLALPMSIVWIAQASEVLVHTLNIYSTSGGSVSTPGEGSFQHDHGSSVSIQAIAEANHHFVEWTGTSVDAGKVTDPRSASTTVTVDADYTLQANFAIDQRILNVSSTLGGSVTLPGEGPHQYDHGTLVPIAATAEVNYHFVNWTGTAVDAGKVAEPSSPNTTVAADADYTLQANFKIHQRTLTISSTVGGSVSAPGEGSFEYDHGATVPIAATVDLNYHFVNWTGTAVDLGKVADPDAANTAVAVDADYTLQANFAIDQRTLTTSSTNGGSVTTPGEGNLQYNHGEVVSVVASPDVGYAFVNWTGTAADMGKVADAGSASTSVTVDGDYTLHANFALVQKTLTTSSTDGGAVTTPGEGAFQYDYGTLVPVVASAAPGYAFVNWTGTAVDAGKVTNATLASTSVMVDGDYTLHATFAIIGRALIISSTAGGSVTTPGEGNLQYGHGQVVSVVASPNVGYAFVNWTGTAVDAGKVAAASSASTGVTVDGDYTLQANFAVIGRSLTISSTTGGSVTTPGEGNLQYNHGEVVSVVANPDVGYSFVNWTGTAVDAGKVADASSAGTSVTVDADYTLQANFAAISRALIISSTTGGSVTTPGEGEFQYDHGQVVPVVASADDGCVFVNWTGTAVDAGKVADATSPTTDVIADDSYTLRANFALKVDLNRDGQLDLRDVEVFSRAWLSVPADHEWNVVFDVNSDEQINWLDWAIFASASDAEEN